MTNDGRKNEGNRVHPVDEQDDAEDNAPAPFTTRFEAPSHLIYTSSGRQDYSASSDFWDTELPLRASGSKEVTSTRRRVRSSQAAEAVEEGARIDGKSVTPGRARSDEETYDVEVMLPVPGANKSPLVDFYHKGEKFYRFTKVSHYSRGPDINFVPGGPDVIPDSEAVLANLDRVNMLPSFPEGLDRERYVEMMERKPPEAVRGLGDASILMEFPTWKRHAKNVPFNSDYLDRHDPDIHRYSVNRLRMDLTRDFSRYWPVFPYVCQDHPNRYFHDVEGHLRTLQPVWGLYGNQVLARGWNAFAQDRTGNRKPTPFSRGFLPGSTPDDLQPMLISELEHLRLPANSSVSLSWTIHHPHHNVALFMGPKGGNVFALDIDVTDREAIGTILRIIEREVGLSPFIRVGSYPKIALIYRMAPGESLRSRVATFEDPDLGAIEIQGVNKALTAYGIHHKLRSCFQWVGSATPAEHGPEHAPTLSASDLDHLLSVISEEVGAYRTSKSWSGEIREGARVSGTEGGDWVVNEDGLVVDGRHAFVMRTTYVTMQDYAGNVRVTNELPESERNSAQRELADTLTGIIVGGILPRIYQDRQWSPESIASRVHGDVIRMIRIGREKGKFSEYDTAEPISLDGEVVPDSGAKVRHRVVPTAGITAAKEPSEVEAEPVLVSRDIVDVSMADAAQPSMADRMSASGLGRNVIVRGQKIGLLGGISESAVRRWLRDKASISVGGVAGYEADRKEREAAEQLEQERRRWEPDETGNRCRSALDRIVATILPGRLLQEDKVQVVPARNPIPMPRPSQAADIACRMEEVVRSVSDEIYADTPLDANRPVLLVTAPTGAGKTSRMIEEIVRDPRTVEDMLYLDDKGNAVLGRRPVVIAMPTYDNISEAIARARLSGINPMLDDDDFLNEVVRLEIMGMGDARSKLSELRETAARTRRNPELPPLDIQIYSGRERAGCPYVSAINALGDAGQGGDRMCRAEKTDRHGEVVKGADGKPVMTLCPRYNECAYIRQKSTVSSAHVVFIPHAFLGENRLPDALKNARVLIVDEQIHPQYLHRAFLRFDEFTISPDIFRYWQIADDMDEVKHGRYEQHNAQMTNLRGILAIRQWLLSRVFQALRSRQDPARVLMSLREGFDLSGWKSDEVNGTAPPVNEDDEDFQRRSNDPYCCDERYVVSLAEAEIDEWGVSRYVGDLPETAGEAGCVSAIDALGLLDQLDRYLSRQDVRIKPAHDREAGPSIPDVVQTKLDQPGVRNARAERRMWMAISERIDMLKIQDRIDNHPTLEQARYETTMLKYEQMVETDPSLAPMIAQARKMERSRGLGVGSRLHDLDARFQLVTRREAVNGHINNVETLRFSWRDTAGWERTPVVLLDASASTRVIGKIFKDREVQVHNVVEDVGASLNMHMVAVTGVSGLTFSNASLIGGPGIASKINSAINMTTVRDAIAVICASHANTRVVMGSGKKVREASLVGWSGRPSSLDSCHFGAIRGIDAYKAHGASVCLGRMELAIEEIDAIAACLSWDDEKYEPPFNAYGNGTTDGNPANPLYQPDADRVVRLRNGGTVTFKTPTIPGEWGAIIQKQAREEEINQFIGRSRPVYRKDDLRPTCYIMSNTFPEHLIIDEVVSIYDIAGAVPVAEGKTSNFPLVTPETSLGSFEALYRDRAAMAGILQDCAWSDPSGSFLAPQAILESDRSGLIPGITDDRNRLYGLLRDHGFQHEGPWMQDADGKEMFGVPSARRAVMADGWVGMVYDSADGLEGIWTPSIIWKSVDVAIAALHERVRLLGGAGGRVLSRPEADRCHRREMDAIDHLIRSGHEFRAVLDRRNLTAQEAAAVQAAAEAARRPVRRMFEDTMTLLTQVPFGQFVGAATIQAPALRLNRNEIDSYRIMPALLDILDGEMAPTTSRGMEMRDIALSRPLTRRQAATLLSLWHTTSRSTEAQAELPIIELMNMIQARITQSRINEDDTAEPDIFVPTDAERAAVAAMNVAVIEKPKSDTLANDDAGVIPEGKAAALRSDIGPCGDLAPKRFAWNPNVYRPAINLIRRTPPVKKVRSESRAGTNNAR